MHEDILYKVMVMVLVSFLFVAAIIPYIKKVAEHVGAMDIPDKRKIHKEPMPRLGGLGIYLGFLLCYMLFGVIMETEETYNE